MTRANSPGDGLIADRGSRDRARVTVTIYSGGVADGRFRDPTRECERAPCYTALSTRNNTGRNLISQSLFIAIRPRSEPLRFSRLLIVTSATETCNWWDAPIVNLVLTTKDLLCLCAPMIWIRWTLRLNCDFSNKGTNFEFLFIVKLLLNSAF